MEIRPIQKKDDDALASIIRMSLEASNLAIAGTAYFDPELKALSAYYAKSVNRNYFVVIGDDKVLGGIGIAEFCLEKNICELQKLYLSKKARGKGYSHQLMDCALTFAIQSGYSAIYLESHHSLQAALSLYQKYGFKQLSAPLYPTAHNAMDCFLLREI
ncbi:N-acetyltransferase [Enterococcus saigonensis]|uniref:N-acetyltransferase n=1 Tax=Enterococcus saigonensis TaxID=1805431 RepID=A0A679IGP0_9ENTE|nr:GNAT family N-acetyltransferase [Enterococcus saigonensis]BCA85062.1 N-acetyltransferase [Enterococcus saigonensis]